MTELTPWMTDKIGALLRFAEKNGIRARVVSGRRTCAEQNAIYDSGTGATQVRGCRSWHVWGRAADLHIDGPIEDYAVLGDRWKRWGGVWGGDFGFGDFGHFEWHPDVTMNDVCPSAAACPPDDVVWAEDRPFLARPAVKLVGGLILAGSGLALSRKLLSR